MKQSNKLKKVCIVGAKGCVGTFFKKLLSPMAQEVISIDPAYAKTSGHEYNYDLNQVADHIKQEIFTDATIVVFAVSTDTFIPLFNSVLPFLPKSIVVVDTTSTKCKIEQYYAQILQQFPQCKPEILSVDPLFRPGIDTSYQPIMYFAKNAGNSLEKFIEILKNAGCHPFEATAEEHDAALSIVQVAVHALALIFGKTIIDGNFSFEMLLKYATPPFRLVILLLYRIISGAPEVYWDVQHNNVLGEEARQQLQKSLTYLSDVVNGGQFYEFTALIEKIKKEIETNLSSEMATITFNQVNTLLEPYYCNASDDA